MLRAVLDPNVLVSGLLSPQGATGEILSRLRASEFELVASEAVISEVSVVLRREKFRRWLSLPEVDSFVEVMREVAQMYPDPTASALTLLDPDDRFLVDLTVASEAHVLVSGDAHLLNASLPVRVISPRQFLDYLQVLG